MNSFFVPLYCQTNALSAEKLAIGLIMVKDNQPHFKLSAKKLKLAAQLCDVNEKFFHAAEKFIGATAKQLQPSTQSKIFSSKEPMLNKETYDYLHKYSNGLLTFGEVMPFADPHGKITFLQLFKQYTGEGLEKEHKPTFQKQLKKYLNKPELKEHADIGFVFKPQHLPGIYQPTTAEVIAYNGSLEVLMAIDGEAHEQTVIHHLLTNEILYHALKAKHKAVKKMPQLKKMNIAYRNGKPSSAQSKLIANAQKNKSALYEWLKEDEVKDFANSLAQPQYKKYSELAA